MFGWQVKFQSKSPDVKVTLKLSMIKPLHAKWIVDLHHHLKAHKEMIVNGFGAAGIFEPIENAQPIAEKVENRFKEIVIFIGNIVWLKQKMRKFFFGKKTCFVFSSLLPSPLL